MEKNKTVEEYLSKRENWKEELITLREILLSTEMDETVKWGMPVYTINNKNVVGIGAFKNYFGLWFYQGSFLNDDSKVLINAQEGVTKGMRQWRFCSADEIDKKLILNYINEAIQNQKDGKEIKAEKKNLEIPQILNIAFDSDLELKAAFEGFTAGKQKEFANYISEAKQDSTKQKRLDKIKPMIISGVGLNDKYRN